MPAFTNEEGENFADEMDYLYWNPVLKLYVSISLDRARGKVIEMTEVRPYDGHIRIFLRDQE